MKKKATLRKKKAETKSEELKKDNKVTDGKLKILKEVAKDIVNNLVFTDRHIIETHRQQMMPSVFMPLAFMDEAQHKMLKDGNVGMVYEYYNSKNASGRSINGYPIFGSLKWMSVTEAGITWEYVKKYRDAIEDVK